MTHFLDVVDAEAVHHSAEQFDCHECGDGRTYAAIFEDTPTPVLDADLNGETVIIQGWAYDEWFCDEAEVEDISSVNGGVAVQFRAGEPA